MNKREVSFLRVHDLSALFKGIGPGGLPGNLTGNQLPDTKRPIKGLKMFEGQTGVEIAVEGQGGLQIIPYTNIQKYDVVDPEHVTLVKAPEPGIWAKKLVPTISKESA